MKPNVHVHIGQNPELDNFIQEILFKEGYRWNSVGTEYLSIGIRTYRKDYCIFIENDPRLLYGDRSYEATRNSKELGVVQFLEHIKKNTTKVIVQIGPRSVCVDKNGCKKLGLTNSDIKKLYEASLKFS